LDTSGGGKNLNRPGEKGIPKWYEKSTLEREEYISGGGTQVI